MCHNLVPAAKRVTLTPEQAAKVRGAVNRGFARSAEECINRAFDLFLAEHGHPANSDGSR
jgi:hypothetical protein